MVDNLFLNAQEFSNAMMLLVKNTLVWGRRVNGMFSNQVTDENGLVVSVKAPPQFIASTGEALQTQRLLIGSRTISVDKYRGVHFSVGDLEFVRSFNDLMQSSTMMSAASTLAHKIDSDIADAALEFYSMTGTVGESFKTPQQFFPMHTRLMAQGVPNEQLSAVLAFVDGANIRGNLVGGQIDGVNRSALERTRIPVMSEIDSYATQHVPFYTNGTHVMSAGPLVNGANQNSNYADVRVGMTDQLAVDGLGASTTIKRGETFVIAGVFEYDNRQGKVLADLQRFSVLADVTATAGGLATLTIAPPMIVPGTSDGVDTTANTAFGTINSIPADNAALTFDGTVSQVLSPRVAFHKRAISLVGAKLHRPFSDTVAFTTDRESGLSIRYWRGSDIATGAHIHRFDTIYGVANMDRRLGTRGYGLV